MNMHTNGNIVGIGLALGLALAAQAQDGIKKPDTSKLPPPSAKQNLTYESDIKPIVEASCLKCHSGERPKAKYSMESKEGFLKGSPNGQPPIVAGKSEDSPMVWFVSDLILDMEMPPTGKRDQFPALSKEQVAVLRAWIDQGAK